MPSNNLIKKTNTKRPIIIYSVRSAVSFYTVASWEHTFCNSKPHISQDNFTVLHVSYCLH
uniref:Uncharacterized protein n=1 Tax=Anguilla anguilla TaxID=7936 RepID=A0A0E9RK19_ANGAN